MSEMRTEHQPFCMVCNGEGFILHEGVIDRFFGVNGRWNVWKCNQCSSLWLDPRPAAADAYLAYARYYTHDGTRQETRSDRFLTRLRRLYFEIKVAYALDRSKSVAGQLSFRQRAAAGLVKRWPARRVDAEGSVGYNFLQPCGTVLDVGCGNGAVLEALARLGWDGEGIDVDEQAVTSARSRGVSAHVGDIWSRNYPDDHFDAIVMSHVIEHVYSPAAVLAECYRVLKPGGMINVITPNANSWLHDCFGADWRGLEVPRHVVVFSKDGLCRLVQDAGLRVHEFRSTAGGARGIAFSSSHGTLLEKSSSFSRAMSLLRAGILQWREGRLLRQRPFVGEELVLIAQKPGGD